MRSKMHDIETKTEINKKMIKLQHTKILCTVNGPYHGTFFSFIQVLKHNSEGRIVGVFWETDFY